MRLIEHCIKKPIVAWTSNLLLMFIGWLCLDHMVVREYPAVVFNKFTVHTHYHNASTDLVETAVTSVLEDRLAGIDGVAEITSDTEADSSNINLSFRENISLDRAWMSIREAIGLARDDLPHSIHEPVVRRHTASNGTSFMFMSLSSPHLTSAELKHYALQQLKNTFQSIPGIIRVDTSGSEHNYQVSLRQHDMYAFGINADEVYEALAHANTSRPVGKFQGMLATTLETRLKNPSDYENLIVKVVKDEKTGKSTPVLLKYVADVALKDRSCCIVRVNGQEAVTIGLFKAEDANPLEVSREVRKILETLKQRLPQDMKLQLVHDQANFVRDATNQMRNSLLEAVLCVGLVMWLFLRNIKSVIIPLVTIPMSLLGSIIFLSLCGMSINLMTLMAMVLAVGLVVDDAIVVLENIQRHIVEGLSPLEAALKGGREISFAIIAMTATLMSVYIPLAFIHGTVGQLFGEFAVALAGSVLVSGLVALTLSPGMCTWLLPQTHTPDYAWVTSLTQRYKNLLTSIMSNSNIGIGTWVLTLALTLLGLNFLPHEVSPTEDRGFVGVNIAKGPNETKTQMDDKLRIAEKYLSLPEASINFTFGSADWGGNIIFPLQPLGERKRSADACMGDLTRQAREIPCMDGYAWSWSTGLPGVDDPTSNNSIDLILSTTGSHKDLFEDVEQALRAIRKNYSEPLFTEISQNVNTDIMAYRVEMNRHMMALLGISEYQVAKTMEVFFHENNSINFSKDGVLYYITLKGRTLPNSLSSLYVTNSKNARISLSTLAQMKLSVEAANLYHFGGMRSIKISTPLPKGMSIAQAMKELSEAFDQHLKGSYTKSWLGLAKMSTQSHGTMVSLLCLSLVFILGLLILQFQNFVDPFIIVLTVPFATSGALLCMWLFGQTLNIYTQIGLITLVGLITKHGILIVEFVNQRLEGGEVLKNAIVQAAEQRLRPILMTTMAMLLGALPLIISSSSGYEARRALGITLLSGLAFGTLLTLLVLPVLCLIIKGKQSLRVQ